MRACDRDQKTLHSWIIVAYAVVQAQHRAAASYGTLGEGFQKRIVFSLLR